MLCASLPELTAAQGITMTTTFCQHIASPLCSLYDKMPAVMDPADIESVEAKWGYVVIIAYIQSTSIFKIDTQVLCECQRINNIVFVWMADLMFSVTTRII